MTLDNRHWAILQHCDAEGPGLIARELAHRALPFTIYPVDRAPLPPVSGMAGLVVMGGPMGVYEADRYPFLSTEMELLHSAVARGLPVLGICLGAQLLAAALGAPVTRGEIAEIGAGEVELTEAGLHDPLLGGVGRAGQIAKYDKSSFFLPVVHWHQDTFALPVGAELLATSRLYRNQAFRLPGQCVYGLQFHIEIDAALAAAWQPLLPPGLELPSAHLARVEATGRGIVARYLDSASAMGAGRCEESAAV